MVKIPPSSSEAKHSANSPNSHKDLPESAATRVSRTVQDLAHPQELKRKVVQASVTVPAGETTAKTESAFETSTGSAALQRDVQKFLDKEKKTSLSGEEYQNRLREAWKKVHEDIRTMHTDTSRVKLKPAQLSDQKESAVVAQIRKDLAQSMQQQKGSFEGA